jgi:hypothetical protein
MQGLRMLPEGENPSESEEMPEKQVVSENMRYLLELRDRVKKEVDASNLLTTDGSTIFFNPKFNYYKDILGMLIQMESKERHDKYKREDLIISQTMRQTGDVETNVDSDFESFCKKYGISLTRKEDKRVKYDKS